VIPISEKHIPPALDVMQKLSSRNIRVDFDDRDETLSRKIRDGEKEWIPYLVVVGDKEVQSGILSVRSRAPKAQLKLPVEELVRMIHEQTQEMPFREMMFPKELSKRPMFVG
jgi:threonyl-tRNA synthetase